MNKNTVTIVSIVSILILEGLAIFKGMDGVALAAGVGAIAGLGGFRLGKILKGGD